MDNMYPDDDILPPMNPIPLGLPSPASSRSSTPSPSTVLQAVSTTLERSTPELALAHTMDIVRENDAMNVVQVDVEQDYPTSPHASDYAIDTRPSNPEPAADDDTVSMGSPGPDSASLPCHDSEETDSVEDHAIDTGQDDIRDHPHGPIDESVLEPLRDAFVYRYGFCYQDVKDFYFSNKALDYSRDTLDKATQAYVHRNEVVPRCLHMPIIEFADILVTNYRIEEEALGGSLASMGKLWDLSMNSPHRLPLPSPQTEAQLSPALRVRAVTCATTRRVVYIITEANGTKFTYSLVLEHATTALECYRRNWQSLLSVAKNLIQSGKAFRTYIPRDPRFTGTPLRRVCRPLCHRSWNHVFGLVDYHAYEDARRELFDKPFGRAAVLTGGLIWRLAADTIGDEVVLQGPSTHAHEFGDLIADPTGKQFVDDTLSEEEMDLICGKYVMYTGKTTKQVTYKWWWPPHSTWITGSYYVGYWTEQCERWYQDRLEAIKTGKARPLTRKEWRAVLHRCHSTRPLVQVVEAASSNYFQGKYYH
jgi:hypothetical protein